MRLLRRKKKEAATKKACTKRGKVHTTTTVKPRFKVQCSQQEREKKAKNVTSSHNSHCSIF